MRKINFARALVALSVLFLIYGFLANYGLIRISEEGPLFWTELFILFGGGFSAVSLWLWMLYDFLKRRPDDHPVLWGVLLLFLNFIAAIAYYFSVYRDRSESQKP